MSKKRVFSSALILSVLGSLAYTFLYQARSLVLGQFTPVQFPALNWLSVPLYLILAIGLYFFSRKHTFSHVFQGTFFVLSGLLTVSSVLLLVQDSTVFDGAETFLTGFLPQGLAPIYAPLLRNWTGSLFAISSSLISMQLLLFFVWGFVNQFMTTREGIRYYLPAAFILALPGSLIPLISGGLQMLALDAPFVLAFASIAILDAMLLFFRWSYPRLEAQEAEPEVPASKSFPTVGTAYMMAAPILAYTFFNLFLKLDLRTQIPDFAVYADWMGNYSSCLGASLLVLSIAWIAIGFWLLQERGWGTTALVGSVSILAASFLYLGHSLGAQNPNWLFHGLFAGLLRSTSTALFFPLAQILYLRLPTATRFNKKVAAELIALPLMKGAPGLLIQVLIVTFGSLNALAFPLKAFSLVLLGLLVLVVKHNYKFQKTNP